MTTRRGRAPLTSRPQAGSARSSHHFLIGAAWLTYLGQRDDAVELGVTAARRVEQDAVVGIYAAFPAQGLGGEPRIGLQADQPLTVLRQSSQGRTQGPWVTGGRQHASGSGGIPDAWQVRRDRNAACGHAFQ